MSGENNETVQSEGTTGEDYEALHDSVMAPSVETSEPTEGNIEGEVKSEVSDVKQEPTNTEGMLTLKHGNFGDEGRQFTTDKTIEYAQKGIDYEIKMRDLKEERKTFEESKTAHEGEVTRFGEGREYWTKMDKYMDENPGFGEICREQWAKKQNETYTPVSPETQALNTKIAELTSRLDSKDTEALSTKTEVAKKGLDNSIAEYKKEHSDFDWDAKDEFGKNLDARIGEFQVNGGFRNYKDAANIMLLDQHKQRAVLKAKEDAAKELQKQRKLGLGPITDRSVRTTTQAKHISQISYQELANEAIEGLGLTS